MDVNFYVEVKKDDAWIPAVAPIFLKNFYDNNWIFSYSGDIAQIMNDIASKGFPEDSKLLDEIKEAYPGNNGKLWANKWLRKRIKKHKSGGLNTLLLKLSMGDDKAFDYTWGHSYVTLADIRKVGDDLRKENIDKIKDYAQNTVLMQEIKKLTRKDDNDDEEYYYPTIEDFEDDYEFENWSRLEGIIECAAKMAGVPEWQDEDIRIIYWFD